MEIVAIGANWSVLVIGIVSLGAVVTAALLVWCVIAETCITPKAMAERQSRRMAALTGRGDEASRPGERRAGPEPGRRESSFWRIDTIAR